MPLAAAQWHHSAAASVAAASTGWIIHQRITRPTVVKQGLDDETLSLFKEWIRLVGERRRHLQNV